MNLVLNEKWNHARVSAIREFIPLCQSDHDSKLAGLNGKFYFVQAETVGQGDGRCINHVYFPHQENG